MERFSKSFKRGHSVNNRFNGAGKSTLLKSIMGMVRPSSGDVEFEGNSILKRRVHERVREGLSYVPEGRRLFPAMTVEENLLMGVSAAHGRSRMAEALSLFTVLEERKKQLAGNLSGGEQQMLAIGRAYMAGPRYCYWMSFFRSRSGDVRQSTDSIKAINERGVSILMAEQNSERALEISSESYVLENGRVALEGKSADLINDPSVQAAYLGTI